MLSRYMVSQGPFLVLEHTAGCSMILLSGLTSAQDKSQLLNQDQVQTVLHKAQSYCNLGAVRGIPVIALIWTLLNPRLNIFYTYYIETSPVHITILVSLVCASRKSKYNRGVGTGPW